MGEPSHQADGNLLNFHIYLYSFLGRGHTTPLFRLAKRLANFGFYVTFAAGLEEAGRIFCEGNVNDPHEPTPLGRGMIRFEFFDDGWDHGGGRGIDEYVVHLEHVIGREKLPKAIMEQAEHGRPPVSCLIHNPYVSWVSDVARRLGIPSAVSWVLSAACLSAYYRYYHKLVPFPTKEDPKIDVQLPSMPVLKYDEIPSCLHPDSAHSVLATIILGQFKNLPNSFCVLMDSFQELEPEIINSMTQICGVPIRAVGPLFKQIKLSPDSNDSIKADLNSVDDCTEFLNSKPPRSVVYIAFGSVVKCTKEQAEEFAHGILATAFPFLWVMRPEMSAVLPKGFLENIGERGKVVQWCSQEKVLDHPSVACTVTHCGWNSAIEAISSGIPVVVFPQWADHTTTAKFLVDVYRVGVWMRRGEDEGRIVGREEVEGCLREAVTSEEIHANAMKWKKLAEEAMAEGGSSSRNMVEFVDEIIRFSSPRETYKFKLLMSFYFTNFDFNNSNTHEYMSIPMSHK